MGGLIVILGYVLVIGILVALGVLFYLRAVASRKLYRCPQCGEVVRTELMKAAHCNSCGAPFEPS